MSEAREYLIKKGSYFYRPNCQGYTSFKFDAGRYTKSHAEKEAAIEPWHMQAIHQDDVPEETAPDKAFSELKKNLDHWRHEVGKLHSLMRRAARDGRSHHTKPPHHDNRPTRPDLPDAG